MWGLVEDWLREETPGPTRIRRLFNFLSSAHNDRHCPQS
jgi:hypothetical protein